MKYFNSLSIKWKIILLIVVSSVLSLLIVCFVFVYKDLSLFKSIYINNLSNMASIIGHSSRAALFFEDKEAAEKILSSLKKEKQIHYAALYNANGEIFQEFGTLESNKYKVEQNDVGSIFGPGFFNFDTPVSLKGKVIGRLVLYGELNEYQNIVKKYLVFVAITFWGIVGLVVFFAIKTHKIISTPILSLASTAREISQNPDFSLRVKSKTRGEIGTLFSAFNSMLSELEKRDEELLDYKNHLEDMVKERTENLQKTNELLVNEIEEKKVIQDKLGHSLNEKEILLKEVQHRAKNNMQILSSLIWLQTQEMEDRCCAEKFEEFGNRVRSMALVHEKVIESSNLKEINMRDYLNEFSNELGNALFKNSKEVGLEVKCGKFHLDMDRTLACGLIVNELVSNAYKHGFPGKTKGEIEISGQCENDNRIILSVTDNGIGFPEGFDIENVSSLGLDIVKSLTKEKLGGNVSLRNTGKTQISIEFNKDSNNHGNN